MRAVTGRAILPIIHAIMQSKPLRGIAHHAEARSAATVTIVDGHPDADREHLNHALADRYAAAAGNAGYEVCRINIAELDVPLLRVPSDFFSGTVPPALQNAQRDMRRADHLVFFFPLWAGDMPALLKSFIEQTFRPGFALDYGTGRFGFPKRLLTGKSARIVVTMGMPSMLYRTLFGAHAVKAFRSMLRFAGMAPVTMTLLGNVAANTPRGRASWMHRMEVLARRDGRSRAPAWVVLSIAGATALAAAGYAAIRSRRATS